MTSQQSIPGVYHKWLPCLDFQSTQTEWALSQLQGILLCNWRQPLGRTGLCASKWAAQAHCSELLQWQAVCCLALHALWASGPCLCRIWSICLKAWRDDPTAPWLSCSTPCSGQTQTLVAQQSLCSAGGMSLTEPSPTWSLAETLLEGPGT